MSIEHNTDVAARFVEIWNARDLQRLDALLHPDFRWHIAVTEPGVAKRRDLHSNLLQGRNLPWEKVIYDKTETLRIFAGIFGATPEFSLAAHSYTAQDDRVVVEVVGKGLNTANGRRYDNLYCYVLGVEGGQLKLFREYQDTLLLFDVWVAK